MLILLAVMHDRGVVVGSTQVVCLHLGKVSSSSCAGQKIIQLLISSSGTMFAGFCCSVCPETFKIPRYNSSNLPFSIGTGQRTQAYQYSD